jgi:hypothetical protein
LGKLIIFLGLQWDLEEDGEGGHTKSIESLDDVASLLPKGILVQAMRCEAVHLLRFFSFNDLSFALTPTCQIGTLKECIRGNWSAGARMACRSHGADTFRDDVPKRTAFERPWSVR